MIPELAAVYVAGLLPSAAMTAIHALSHRRKMQAPPIRQLQNNLAKVGLYWSDALSEVRSLKGADLEQEARDSRQTLLIIGAGAFVLSWLGFFLMLLLYAAMNHFAVSRTEKRLLSSELSQEDLDSEAVSRILKELQP